MGGSLLHAVLTSRVYDVARETPLEPAPRLSRRLGHEVPTTPARTSAEHGLVVAIVTTPIAYSNTYHKIILQFNEIGWKC